VTDRPAARPVDPARPASRAVDPARPASGSGLTAWALGLAAVAGLLLLGAAAAGPSAVSPALTAGSGWRATLPPWSLGLAPAPGLITAVVDAGYLLGAAGVGLGLLAARRGASVPRAAVWIACAAAVLAVLLPPIGSADHLSYAAYGRIAAGGGDPYVVPPASWAGGGDPVAGAVEPPWTTTPSVYGPVATAVQAGVSLAGADSVRATVWCWQLICLAGWLFVGLALIRHGRNGSAAGRAGWLWLLNPVLFGLLLLGAHVDLLAAAAGLAAVLLAGRRPVLAGALLGAAVGIKLTAVLIGPAVVWALWRRHRRGCWRPIGLGLLGSAAVLVPAHLWAGAHVFDQLGRARRFVSLATPWRPLVDAVTEPLGNDTTRAAVVLATPVVVIGLAVLIWRAAGVSLRCNDSRLGDPVAAASDAAGQVTRDAALGSVVLGAAYVLGAPYSLPWYDALAWFPLALVGSGALDAVLLARLTAYAVAYVPGRVIGSSQRVQDLTLGYRREVAPWIGLALLLALGLLARRRATPACSPR
jgi:hypothetical protein